VYAFDHEILTLRVYYEDSLQYDSLQIWESPEGRIDTGQIITSSMNNFIDRYGKYRVKFKFNDEAYNEIFLVKRKIPGVPVQKKTLKVNLCKLIGYLIFLFLIAITITIIVVGVMSGNLVLAGAFVVIVPFGVILSVFRQPNCICFLYSDWFRGFGRWFMNDLLVMASYIFLTVFVLVAVITYFSRSNALPIIVFISFIGKVIAAALWSYVFVAILEGFVCPLICTGCIDWSEAGRNAIQSFLNRF
jgi:hypothetical protein